jgi:hypothetical protein
MTEPSVVPVGTFNPSPGLFIDRTEKSVVIGGLMELSGAEATVARASAIQQSINLIWTQTFSDGSSVRCNVTVRYRGPGSKAGNVTQIQAAKIAGPSHVTPGLFSRSMTLNANEQGAFTWTPAHEFGHIIGLQDRYSEPIMSKIRSIWGGARINTVQPGYANNIMAVDGGVLTSQNLADLAAENEPSPFWVNDDDQVRAWVGSHSSADIARLSGASKLRAIQALQGGSASAEDMAAIRKICGSVRNRSEAEAIRAGVDLRAFTDIGQRTTMRVILVQMP